MQVSLLFRPSGAPRFHLSAAQHAIRNLFAVRREIPSLQAHMNLHGSPTHKPQRRHTQATPKHLVPVSTGQYLNGTPYSDFAHPSHTTLSVRNAKNSPCSAQRPAWRAPSRHCVSVIPVRNGYWSGSPPQWKITARNALRTPRRPLEPLGYPWPCNNRLISALDVPP